MALFDKAKVKKEGDAVEYEVAYDQSAWDAAARAQAEGLAAMSSMTSTYGGASITSVPATWGTTTTAIPPSPMQDMDAKIYISDSGVLRIIDVHGTVWVSGVEEDDKEAWSVSAYSKEELQSDQECVGTVGQLLVKLGDKYLDKAKEEL